MAITIIIDNDPLTAGIQTLVEDESLGLQTPLTADTGNDSNVDITDPTVGTPDPTLTDGTLSGAGYSAAFLSFLNAGTIFGSAGLQLSDTQKAFAANVEGAVSSSSFVTVTASGGETINDLFFSDSSGNALAGAQVAGMTTLDGSSVYLWSMGDFAIATTSSTAGAGRVVAAFYLNEAANHLSAQVQMMTFEALKHPDSTNPDDALNFTNALQISAAGTTSFDFNSLQSGDFLWVAVGSGNSAVLVTGGNPQVDSNNKITNTSDDIHVSQGGDGTTIGINNQLFDAANETGVFTLVKGLATLPSGTTGAGGSYTVDPNTHDNKLEGIDYSDYLNVAGAGIYISQSQGTPSVGKSFEVKLLNAGPPIEDLTNYIPGLASDGTVNVGTVTVKDDAGHVVGIWGTGGLSSGTTIHNVSPNGSANVQVIISGNTIDVNGVLGNYTVDWTAASGTFNRFDLTWEAGKFDVGRVDVLQGAGSSLGIGGDLVVQDSGPSISADITGAPSITDDESNLAIDNTGNYAAQFTPVYGTDGPGASAVTYALSTPGGDSGLVDTASGNHVFLFLESGKIVGREGTTAGTAAGGPIVFTVSVDGAGTVTLDQQRAIVHPDPTNPDDSKTLSAANLVVLTATAHDGDGDTAGAPLNIGQLLNFKDDGPSVTASITGAPTITDDESNLAINNSATYAAQFTPTYGADGQGPTPISYALSTPGGDCGLVDTASGNHVFLFLESGVVVGREGADAASAAAGPIVFTVSVDGTGKVTLDQQRAIVHPDPTNPDDSKTLSAANLVTLTATVHDGDGDTGSAPLDIGQLLNFKDDGPSITASATGAPSITDDETNLGIDNSANYAAQFTPTYGADGQGATPVTYGLSTPGGDSGLVDTASGNHVFLFYESGQVVGREGTDAISAAGGPIVFTVSVDGTGKVTLDQQRAIVHPDTTNPDDSKTLSAANLVVLSATAHDGDGDSASAPLNIGQLLNFKDDGPSITASSTGAPTITDDESNFAVDNSASYAGQFSPTYGADGQAATPVTYAISSTNGADSGLIESGSGNHIFLFNESGQVVGRAGTSALTAATGDIVFVASIDGTGKVTLDQRLAVVHTPNNGPNDSTTLSSAGLVVVTATAHDGDGDSASTGLNIGTLLNFQDDAPTILSQILGGTVEFATDATGTVTHSLNGSIGADGTSSTQASLSGVAEYTISYWDTPTNVYPNLNAVLSNNGTTLTYYSDLADTNAVYRLTLNATANSGAGSYTFTVLQPPPITTTHFGFADLHSGQNLFGIIAVNKADLSQGGLLVMPNNAVLAANGTMTNTSGSICTSQGGGGVTIGNTNQAFDHPGEGAYFLYVDNPVATAVSGVGLTPTGANDADTISFNGVNQATDASVEIVQASGKGTLKSPGPAIHIAAYEANPGNVNSDTLARAEVNNPTLAAANQGTAAPEVNVVGVKIHDATGKVIEYRTVDQSAGGANGGALHDVTGDGQVTGADDSLVGIQFVLDNPGGAGTADDIYSVVVSNLALNYKVEFITATNHDLALVENVSGSYDLGGFNLVNNVNVPPQDLHFAATITDYDNDAYGGHLATFADFTVHIDGVVFA